MKGRFKKRAPSIAFWLFHTPMALVSLAFLAGSAFVFWGPDHAAVSLWRELDRDGTAMLPFFTLLFLQPLLGVVATALYFGGRRQCVTVDAKRDQMVIYQGGRTRTIALGDIAGGFVDVLDEDRARLILQVGRGPRACEMEIETDPSSADALATRYLGTSRMGRVAGPSGVRLFLCAVIGGIFALIGAVPLVGALEQVSAAFPRQMWNFLQGFSWTIGGMGAALGLGLFAAAILLRPSSIALGSDGLTLGKRFIPWGSVRHIDQTGWALAVHTYDTDLHEVFAFGRSRLPSWDRVIRERLDQLGRLPAVDLPAFDGDAVEWVATIRKHVLRSGYRDRSPNRGRLAKAVRATGATPELRIAAAVALSAAEPDKAAKKIRIASRELLCETTRAALEAIATEIALDEATEASPQALAIEAAVTTRSRG